MITNSNWKIFWDRGHMSPIFYSTYEIIFIWKFPYKTIVMVHFTKFVENYD